MSLPDAVACRGLVRRFGHRTAIDRLDLIVTNGEVVLLTGPNGAGKTTLLRTLACLLRPTAGSVSVLGDELPTGSRRVRACIGYAGHEPLLYPALTASENLALYAALHGVSPQVVPPALERVGLTSRAGDRVAELSRGMRQRLALARTMLHRPSLLLLDEPTSGLDEEGRGALRELLTVPGVTALVATHEPDWFGPLAGRSVSLRAGRTAE